jgi:hypothetical protein
MGTTGCYGCGGVPVPVAYGTGYGTGYGGVIDADPITPGIQATPGVVTPVGPPRVVGGGAPIGVGIGGPVGVGIGGPIGVGVQRPIGGIGFGGIDADPITPGIQTRPGVVTPVGPPRVVGGNNFGISSIRPGFIPATSTVRY